MVQGIPRSLINFNHWISDPKTQEMFIKNLDTFKLAEEMYGMVMKDADDYLDRCQRNLDYIDEQIEILQFGHPISFDIPNFDYYTGEFNERSRSQYNSRSYDGPNFDYNTRQIGDDPTTEIEVIEISGDELEE